MGKVVVCDHPLIQHKLTLIRDERTMTKDFRQLVDETATLMAYEMTRDLPLRSTTVQTPVASAEAKTLSRGVVLLPVLRAGLGMLDGILKLLPAARIGHIGLTRDETTLQPVEYYVKLPEDAAGSEWIVIDPMLATGGSAIAAVHLLKDRGCAAVKLLCLIAAPEGIRALQEVHPHVDIYTAAIDHHLNDQGYIVPGLGDAGDRLFGTK
jgi:uracil phosphoribosyltransferase